MTLANLELAFRAGTVALLLVLAASLVGHFRNVLAGRLGAAFALGSAAHAASYSIGASSLASSSNDFHSTSTGCSNRSSADSNRRLPM